MTSRSFFRRQLFLAACLCLAVLTGGGLHPLMPDARGQDAGESARTLIEQHKGALVVVSVEGNLETTTDGEPLPEQKQVRRTLGVTVDASGLVVVSNYAIDASMDFVGQRARHEDQIVDIVSAKTTFTRVEISYGDSARLPGQVVMQRPEADLAFIMPDMAAAKRLDKTTFEFVDLGAFSSDVQQADEVVGLSRSSAAFDFMPTVLLGRITGISRSDRTFYLTSVGTAHGVPVFTLDGSPIGITLERIKENKRTGLLATLSAGSVQVSAKMAIDAYKAGVPVGTTPAPAPAPAGGGEPAPAPAPDAGN